MFSPRTGQGRKAEGGGFPGRRLLFVGRGRTGKRGPVARHASSFICLERASLKLKHKKPSAMGVVKECSAAWRLLVLLMDFWFLMLHLSGFICGLDFQVHECCCFWKGVLLDLWDGSKPQGPQEEDAAWTPTFSLRDRPGLQCSPLLLCPALCATSGARTDLSRRQLRFTPLGNKDRPPQERCRCNCLIQRLLIRAIQSGRGGSLSLTKIVQVH